jgi:hypothetical protein
MTTLVHAVQEGRYQLRAGYASAITSGSSAALLQPVSKDKKFCNHPLGRLQ